ncbi:LysR substrate-binding domain-containing protein [Serratia aquatilis]|uniref:LysR substrate-binding domain-containing protein n=1 Tax=Serratia aquatilis TaxID=1737515 RepID=A0ABV6EE53_9GAMM
MATLPDISHLKINHFKVFEALIAHGSIQAAAEVLHQTQASVKRSIKELETTLGVTLVIHGKGGVVLTDIGQMFETRMNLVLNEIQRSVDEIKQIKNYQDGTVVFGCSHLKTLKVLPDVVERVQKKYPKVRISIHEGQQSELMPSLQIGKLDFFIGILSNGISFEEYVEEPLLTCQYCVIARKDHPLAHATSLVELRNAKWYLPLAVPGYYNFLEAIIFPEGQGSECSILRGNSIAVGERLLLEADYLSIVPLPMFNLNFVKNQFCIIPIKESLPDGHYSLIYRKQGFLTPLAKLLIDEIRIECGKKVIYRDNKTDK